MISSCSTPTVYRQVQHQLLCERCRKPAAFRCRACGAPFCADHVEGLELCTACTGKLHALESTGWVPAILPPAVGLLVGWVLPFSIAAWLGLVIAGLFVGQGLRALVVLHRRVRFLSRSRELVLDDAQLQIARGLPEDDFRDQRGESYQCRTRGELPSVPQWQRTYGR